jgi:RIO kinase 1
VKTNDYYVDELDKYDSYEEQFNPVRHNRQARRRRKPKTAHTPKKSDREVIEELADDTLGLEGGFETTYQPSKHEAAWLLSSLRSFYDRAFITDVLSLVKGGKEASVYRCESHESVNAPHLAAKVYRPRMFRSLSNDKMYREGRDVLTPDGRPVGKQADRVARAIGKKTSYGTQIAHTSWLMYEYTTLERLYEAGAAVPKPYAAAENAILMSYHGDAHMPAPTLNEVRLDPDEVKPLFDEVMRNVRLMLEHDLVHGDLSAYNILYWDGEISFIDFPQVVNLYGNSNAYTILERDVTRTCEYFERQGLRCNAASIMEELWYEYGY